MDLSTLLLLVTAGAGTYLLYTALVFGHHSLLSATFKQRQTRRMQSVDDWFAQAGIPREQRKHVVAIVAASSLTGTLFGWMLFGGVLAPFIVGLFSATFPITTFKQRRARRRSEAADAWPRMIEEIRLLCGSLGRPVPQALFETGRRAPNEMRDAFSDAEREWLISTDFGRTVTLLKDRLADATADVVCETLLVAHDIGGADVDQRLRALADDRQMDLHSRKDARARQSGIKFARRFVLVVPIGMALAGLSIGDGRAAYGTAQGQLGVVVGVITLAGCWWWSGRLIQLPHERRVLRA